jgi:branched-chain amino acid transport system permease protein
MSIALSNFIQVTQGPRNKPIPSLVTESYHLGAITVSLKQLIIMVVTSVLLFAFWYIVNKTPLGRAQRATEQDRKMARFWASMSTRRSPSPSSWVQRSLRSQARCI